MKARRPRRGSGMRTRHTKARYPKGKGNKMRRF